MTTPRKYKKYKDSKMIHQPVRGFDTVLGALLWANKIEGKRRIMVKITIDDDWRDDLDRIRDHDNVEGKAYVYWRDVPMESTSIQYNMT
jgi:hypothetical protein